MAYEIKAMREELASVTNELKTLTATVEKDGRNFTDEEIVRFDELDNKRSDLDARVKTAERTERVRSGISVTRPAVTVARQDNAPTSRDYADGFRAVCLSGNGASDHLVRPHWIESAERCGYKLGGDKLNMRTDTGMDLGAANGGATIDGDIFVGLMNRLKMYGGMQKVADVFETENGNPIHFAFSDDVGNSASIIGENTGYTSVPVTSAEVTLSAFTYRSGVSPVSWQLLQDSRVDVVNWVSRLLGIRIARRQNVDWTTGTGSGQPTGFITALPGGQVKTTAAASVITYADINGLIHAVDPMYRDEEEGVCLMMNDATAAYLEVNLKDTTGRPLFIGAQDFGNYSAPAPARIGIMGKSFPIQINQAMPDMSQTTSPCVAFGWFKAYKARIVADLRVDVLRERYADLGAVGVQAYARSDGNLVDGNAIAGLKMHA